MVMYTSTCHENVISNPRIFQLCNDQLLIMIDFQDSLNHFLLQFFFFEKSLRYLYKPKRKHIVLQKQIIWFHHQATSIGQFQPITLYKVKFKSENKNIIVV